MPVRMLLRVSTQLVHFRQEGFEFVPTGVELIDQICETGILVEFARAWKGLC